MGTGTAPPPALVAKILPGLRGERCDHSSRLDDA
jgi:hypothetical protein